MFNFSALFSFVSTPTAEPVIEIGAGTRVMIKTLCYGWQIGTVQFISDSPYCGEEGVQRAFVVGEGWTDYLTVDEVVAGLI